MEYSRLRPICTLFLMALSLSLYAGCDCGSDCAVASSSSSDWFPSGSDSFDGGGGGGGGGGGAGGEPIDEIIVTGQRPPQPDPVFLPPPPFPDIDIEVEFPVFTLPEAPPEDPQVLCEDAVFSSFMTCIALFPNLSEICLSRGEENLLGCANGEMNPFTKIAEEAKECVANLVDSENVLSECERPYQLQLCGLTFPDDPNGLLDCIRRVDRNIPSDGSVNEFCSDPFADDLNPACQFLDDPFGDAPTSDGGGAGAPPAGGGTGSSLDFDIGPIYPGGSSGI